MRVRLHKCLRHSSPFLSFLSWAILGCDISFSLLLLSRGTVLLIPIPGGRLPTFLLGKGLARCKANVPPGKAASPASRCSQNKKSASVFCKCHVAQHLLLQGHAENRAIHRPRETKTMRKTQDQGPVLQTMYSKTRKNKEVNIHELNVLARIVTTTLRSPRESAYSRISTAARLDSGTSPYAVGGGVYLRSRSMASWTSESV